MKPRITNTSTQNPLLHLADAMLAKVSGGSPSDSIVASEKRGQQELVNSDQLPTEGSSHQAWEKMGVVFREVLQDDPLFRNVTLPEGWTKKATEHDMHSDLLDEKGRKRGAIFYKAAFYDRKASIRPLCRYRVDSLWDENYNETAEVVKDCETVIFIIPRKDPEDWEEHRELAQKCRDWLNEKFSNHEDPAAYWETEQPLTSAS